MYSGARVCSSVWRKRDLRARLWAGLWGCLAIVVALGQRGRLRRAAVEEAFQLSAAVNVNALTRALSRRRSQAQSSEGVICAAGKVAKRACEREWRRISLGVAVHLSGSARAFLLRMLTARDWNQGSSHAQHRLIVVIR